MDERSGKASLQNSHGMGDIVVILGTNLSIYQKGQQDPVFVRSSLAYAYRDHFPLVVAHWREKMNRKTISVGGFGEDLRAYTALC